MHVTLHEGVAKVRRLKNQQSKISKPPKSIEGSNLCPSLAKLALINRPVTENKCNLGYKISGMCV